MRFTRTTVDGAWIIDLDPVQDERGSFARAWDHDEFARHGLDPRIAQCNISTNRRRGTLRGLHYQSDPHPDPKLVRCTRGAIHDVVLDLRRGSPTYLRNYAIQLSAHEGRALYVPAGCAHGFQTLEDSTDVFYQMGVPYIADLARGVRWDDPAFAIRWPLPDPILSARDRSYPDFQP